MSFYTDTINDAAVAPSRRLTAVIPHNETKLPLDTKALYIGTGGSLTVQAQNDPDGTSVTFTNLPNAYILDVRALRVLATGTTASNIIALR